MTKAHAKILAGLLSEDALDVLRIYREHKHGQVTQEGLAEVIEHKLITETTNLLNGKEIWILTSDGKKVAEFA